MNRWEHDKDTWTLSYRDYDVTITSRLGGFDIVIRMGDEIEYEGFNKNLNVERAKQRAKHHLFKLAGWPE